MNTSAMGRHFGPYLVQKRLGGGAMATVYQAVDERNGSSVALKVLLAEADDIMRERFHQEARMASALSHPHIIPTLEISQATDEGATFIAMELVQGESLGDLLERVHSLNPADSCAVLAPIASALAYAHQRGVIHRDVKPSNILLQPSDVSPYRVRLSVLDSPVVPLLSDFGIARALDAPDLTSIGRTIGTPAYMAPEQCAGSREIDGRADIYSLGAVLYRCLVGRPPFSGTTTQILYAHVYDAVSVPDDVLRMLSPIIVGILGRTLAKEPADRYASASALADDLTIAAGRPLPIDNQNDATLPAADATATMPLIIPPQLHTTTSHVIVPATRPTLRSSAPVASRAAIPLAPPMAPQQPELRSTANLSRNWRGLLVGVLLVALLFIAGATVVRALLPEVGFLAFSVAATPIETPPITATARSNQATGAITPAARNTGVGIGASTPTPGVTPVPAPIQTERSTDVPPPSPTPGPTPAGDIRTFYDEATALHAERQWNDALNWLTLVQRIDPNFQQTQVERMLFDVYVGLANARNAAGDFTEAVDYYDRALELRPTAGPIEILRAATQAVIDSTSAEPQIREDALRALQERHAEFAADLNQVQKTCDAADQMTAAAGVYPSAEFSAMAASFRSECQADQQRAREQEALRKLAGGLIYSATRDNRSQIFTAPAALGALSQMVIDNGAQPALSPDGVRVAFHSKRPDAQGLAGFDLRKGLDPNARSILFTRFTEDSRDSPPAWNQEGNRLIFASTNESDRRSRVYAVWADGQDRPVMLSYGQMPAWNWATDLVVFNGADASGQRPGLWLMGSDGADPRPLTAGGGDLRPAWTPDGSAVIFMSNERDGNWELYRVLVNNGAIERLTNHPAIDALPTVSPDGQWLAFVSNRDGGWRVWVMSLATGNAFPLTGLAGDLPNPLEHTLQWTP